MTDLPLTPGNCRYSARSGYSWSRQPLLPLPDVESGDSLMGSSNEESILDLLRDPEEEEGQLGEEQEQKKSSQVIKWLMVLWV